jgi:hypothetical protein
MNPDPYLPLYDQLNWDAPAGPLRCTACVPTDGPPIAGSYPSALRHYEAVLGPLPGPLSDARILIVLQDPRAGEHNFVAMPPATDPGVLRGNQHRYFCLTGAAWRALRLDVATGSDQPHWPTLESGPHYLRRYLSRAGSWSYDGFLAYFIDLLRPVDALITNLAKCHFGGATQPRRVYRTCAKWQMNGEASLFQPNLIVSFSSCFDADIATKYAVTLRQAPVINLFHPASFKSREDRRSRLVAEVEQHRTDLLALGIPVDAALQRWNVDVQRTARR